MKGLNKKSLRLFIQRRKINALTLLVLTFVAAVITIVCAVQGFPRTDILMMVTAALVVLCLIQEVKLRKGYRTIREFKGMRKRKKKVSQ